MMMMSELTVPTMIALCIMGLITAFLYRMLWMPLQIQRNFRSQGIDGPRYSFVRGNSAEILKMRQQVRASGPMNSLSHAVNPRIQPHVSSWMNIYGKSFVFWVGAVANLVVSEVDLIKQLLHNKNRVYSKGKISFYVDKFLGDGLSNSADGDKWHRMRKISHNAFHGQSLKNMMPAMVWSAEKMVEKWKNYVGKEIDVNAEFMLLTSEVITRTAFGTNYNQGQLFTQILGGLGKLVKAKEDHQFHFIPPQIFSKMYKGRDDIEIERLEGEMKDLVTGMVREREDAKSTRMVVKTGYEYGTDFLGLLVKSYHDESKEVSVEHIIDECKAFYFAGQHPTNLLLSWTVFLLSTHTHWQEEARNEVVSLFGRDGIPDADGISKLKVLSMIINETLRLYSPVVEVTRKAGRATHLGHLSLPAGVNLVIPILALHHDAEIWGEDVELFKPERFKEGVLEATNHNLTAFMPFGLGPRNCVGSNFVTVEAKIVLSMVLQRYSFTLSPTYVHSIYPGISMSPQHGVQVILQAIE
ncbi:Cytochrome P450 CYP749A22 [Linum grandiflorum]